jgi:hypothetical protein
LRNGIARRTPIETGAGGKTPVETVAKQPDRRSHERFVTVFRLAKLIVDREEFCLVRNLSAGGLKVQVFSPRSVGERVLVDFGDQQPLPARVAWVEDDHIGLSFEDEIDVATALSKAPPPGRSRARPIRLAVQLDATTTVNKVTEACRVLDISQGGAKLEMGSTPVPGDQIVLEIEGLGKLSGVVRWAKKGHVGVTFPGQLPYRQLAAWVGGLGRSAG